MANKKTRSSAKAQEKVAAESTAVISQKKLSADFSAKNIFGAIKKWCYNNRFYLAAFFIPVIMLYAGWIFFDVFPFGDSCVLVLDLNGQYIYYFEYLKKAIWGSESITYCWGRNLSGEFMGIIGYYLASPFTLIVMLLPQSMILGALLIMQLCKIGASAVTFTYFMVKGKNADPIRSLICGTAYALCAYAVIQLMDPMWLDGLVYFPLIALGVERLVDSGNKTGYIVPLALMFIAHFYIGYMIGIFTFCYFLFYWLTSEKKEKTGVYEGFMTWVRFGVGTIAAICIGAVMILPVYYSLSLGKFEFSEPDMSFATQFTVFDFLTKLLPCSYDTVRNEGLPEIYTGVICLVLVPIFYANEKISFRTKISYSMLLAVLFFSMYIRPVDLAWHGFQMPNWLPYRYSFLFSFVFATMAAMAFDKLDGIKPSALGATFFGIAIFCLVMGRLDPETYTWLDAMESIWMTVFCAALICVFLYMMMKHPKRIVFPLLIVMTMALENVTCIVDTFEDIDEDCGYSKQSSYYSWLDPVKEVYEKIESHEDYEGNQSPYFRTEKTWNRTVNDALYVGYRGLTHSSSTMNSPVINFLAQLGLCSEGHYTTANGSTPITDTIFGIKYYIDKDGQYKNYQGDVRLTGTNPMVYPAYELVYNQNGTYGENDVTYTVFENPNYIGLGYLCDTKLYTDQFFSTMTANKPFENQNKIFSSIAGVEYTEYFKPLNFNPDTDMLLYNITETNAVNQWQYTKNNASGDAYIEFYITAQTSDEIFFYLPSIYESKVNIWVNSERDENGGWKRSDFTYNHDWVSSYFEGDYHTIMRIDTSDLLARNGQTEVEPGQVFALRLSIPEVDYTFMIKEQLQFCYFDYDQFVADCANVTSWNIEKAKDTYIKGTITAGENQMLMTSISYEPGWTVKVDGKKTEYVGICWALIGVFLTPGEHTITMRFFPQGLALGIFLMICGIVVTVIFYCYDNNKKIKMANISKRIKGVTKKK